MSTSSQAGIQPRRSSPLLAAFVIGLPLAAGILALFHYTPLKNWYIARYFLYPSEWAEVVMFGVALGAILAKFLMLRIEFDAFDRDILPRWDGKPVPVEKAGDLLSSLSRQPSRIRDTYLGRRIHAALEFLRQRKTTANYDEHLRSLADSDSLAQESSFGLIRFICWGIPILGFLGTVIGITGAIAGITPEVLDQSIAPLTEGLSEAFDSTALALALTMVAMFFSFLIERREQYLLEEVDRLVDAQLAHRFQADTAQHEGIAGMVQQTSTALAAAIESMVERQAQLWAGVLEEPQRRAAETFRQMTEQLVLGLGEAMSRTLGAHEERLRILEQQSVQGSTQLMQQLASLAVAVRDTGREQQQALTRVAEGVAGQAALLAKIQEDEANLVHLQAVLHQNLAALASASSFEDAVHSLTAAVHLLTSRAAQTPMTLRKAA